MCVSPVGDKKAMKSPTRPVPHFYATPEQDTVRAQYRKPFPDPEGKPEKVSKANIMTFKVPDVFFSLRKLPSLLRNILTLP